MIKVLYKLNKSKTQIRKEERLYEHTNPNPYERETSEYVFFEWCRWKHFFFINRRYSVETVAFNKNHDNKFIEKLETLCSENFSSPSQRGEYEFGSDPEIDQFVQDECQCPMCQNQEITSEDRWTWNVFKSFLSDGDKPSQYTKIYSPEKDWADHKAKEISQAMAWGDNPQGILAEALRDALKQGEDIANWSNVCQPIFYQDDGLGEMP